MSCDNWTDCTAIVDLAPCSSLAPDADDYATPAEANLASRQQGRPGLKGYRHEVRSRIVPDSTQTDPEYVWGDEGPIND
jgi:hypothetical protein